MLRPDGSLFLNVGAKPSDPWTALDVAQAARSHLRLQNIIHWIKSIAIDATSAGAAAGLTRDLAVGHYKPINSDRFLNDCHEFIFHFTPHGRDRARSAGARRALSGSVEHRAAGAAAADGVRCRGNTWFIPYETIQRRDRDRPHPATFPVAAAGAVPAAARPVADRAWRWTRSPGLGSTAVACARLGVEFIGAEIDETYLDEAVARTRDGRAGEAGRRRQAARLQRGRLEGARRRTKLPASAVLPLPLFLRRRRPASAAA